jgi:hypothetical protein
MSIDNSSQYTDISSYSSNSQKINVNVLADTPIKYDPQCIRQKTNFSKMSQNYVFDSASFDPKTLLNDIPEYSPKLDALLKKIKELDDKDMRTEGKLYKHFIFSDFKSSRYGAKLLAAAFIASGYNLGYSAVMKNAVPKSKSKLDEEPEDEEPEDQEKQDQEPQQKSISLPSVSTLTVSPTQSPTIPVAPPNTLVSPVLSSAQPSNTKRSISIVPLTPTLPNPALPNPALPNPALPNPALPNPALPNPALPNPAPSNSIASIIQSIPGSISSAISTLTTTSEIKGGAEDDDVEYSNGKKVKKIKIWGKTILHSDDTLLKTPNTNFYLLSSIGVYDNPIHVGTKKAILQKFNQRPENIQGEEIRFIIMDSGFKEGIDLFDIKYIHIFEPQKTAADQKQVIGRGTRTCGQKGLTFHPVHGWPLYVFIYDLSIPLALQSSFLHSTDAFDFYLKSLNIDLRLYTFMDDLEKMSILGSVDYDLNKSIHNFSITPMEPSIHSKSTVGSSMGSSSLWSSMEGGGPKRIIIDKTKSPIIINTPINQILSPSSFQPPPPLPPPPQPNPLILDYLRRFPTISNRLNYHELKEYIQEYYSEFAWTNIKMENLCIPKSIKGGASSVIQFTPTQDFIKHYFTPANPCKGMLLWHSVGTGKTCSAIAAATSSFERQGYTILWITRTTLKSDIWKNMYDQVCSDSIKAMIDQGIDIPSDNKKRMRLLSKSWKIRPMSYKQFSNLVSKQNNIYNNLVKINGQIDPLRKTLLIIDEAHKLYGGNDLSSLERPDMNALKSALMNSYNVSGENSAKLLLMTATPITQKPMELIQLINLCKPLEEQMPDEFNTFASTYLKEDGAFSKMGSARYLDDIAGYISYLNREKDARQFSQPIVEFIRPSIITGQEDAIRKYDKKLVHHYLNSDISELKKKVVEANNNIDADLKDLTASKFEFLLKPCENLDSAAKQKLCTKIVRKNIRELVLDAKQYASQITSSIKDIKEDIKNKNLFKQETLQVIQNNLSENPDEYERFKQTPYYNIKYKCGKKMILDADFVDALQTHPQIIELNTQLSEIDAKINAKLEELKLEQNEYKFKIKQLMDLLKTDITPAEKSAIRFTISDTRKTAKLLIAAKRRTTQKEIIDLKKNKMDFEKQKTQNMKNTKKTMKQRAREKVAEEKAELREIARAEKELRKTLREQGQYEEIQNDTINGLVSEYTQKITAEYLEMQNQLEETMQAKEQAAQEKAVLKQQAAQEKAQAAQEKAQAAQKKAQAAQEKAQAAQEKAVIKQQEKQNKALAKTTKMQNKPIKIRKTKKLLRMP